MRRRRRFTRAEARVQYGVISPEPPPEAYGCPQPMRQSDQYYCRKCALRWDANEDKPPCLKPERN